MYRYNAWREKQLATSGYDMELAEFLETLAVGLHCVGPDGTILRANRAELELLGYERDEYIGRPITDFHVDREVIDDILARLLRGETLRERPARMRRKDGTIREVLITSSGYFEAGRFVHSRCMTADVTELRRAQEAQAQLAAIVESSGDAILSKSLDGTILSWNQGAARLFGYGAAEAVGQNIRLIVPPERESEEQAILERLRRGEAVRFETVRIAKDRRRIDVSVTTSPVRDQQGKVIAASKIARDITEQKRSAETLGALLRISEKLNSTLDVDTLLDILVQEAMALVGARAGAASLYIPEGILTRSYGEAEAAESVTTPIVAADQTVLGFFEVHRQGVTEADRQKLAAVSYPAAIAIQNAVAYSRLQQAEERFARFMQHLPGLAWIKDLNGRYIYANDAAERAFRTPREKLYGRTDDELFPPETAAQFRRNDQRAATSETGIRTVEILEHEDGPHHSLVHKFPIPGPDGRTVLVGGMAIDFTDRIRTEEALRASEQRYRAVLESQAEMVCRFRPDGTILFVNGAYARTLGTTPEELANRNFWDFVSAEDRDGVRAMLDRLTPENPQIQIENRFESHDGTRWTLWTNRALAFDRDGRVVEAQSAGIDITDRKRVEEALRRANADLEQFAYSASHDLQEPIRNIAVFSEILAQRYGHLLDARGLEHLGFVQAGARRMEALVRDLMTYTQVANPDEEPGGAGNAAEALEMALGNLSAAIRESGAEVTSDRLPEVGLPEVLLQQLFQNLVSNAIKYRRDGEPPRIHVGVRRRGAEWLFLVRDNGIGIAAEYHQRVFGIFKRLHGDGKYAGTGIGLAICQRIVERQGGRIWVESEGTGKGSTFCFTVPALTGT